MDDRGRGGRDGGEVEATPTVVPGNAGPLDDASGGEATDKGGGGRPADGAALEARVDRLERQLAVMVKRFAERLNDHERRLDTLDEPPERSWLKR